MHLNTLIKEAFITRIRYENRTLSFQKPATLKEKRLFLLVFKFAMFTVQNVGLGQNYFNYSDLQHRF